MNVFYVWYEPGSFVMYTAPDQASALNRFAADFPERSALQVEDAHSTNRWPPAELLRGNR